MNYQQTIDYLYSRLPMYQRIGAAAYKPNLDNTIQICKLLGNPEKKIKTIHIAGTNGKGSSSHMLASVLQSAGYKTGLYTSPHLKDFRERIKINGIEIPQKYIIDFVKKYSIHFEKIEPSFFEWTVGLAFDYFANQYVDIAVIEVGLGGRLDSTNVIDPMISLITNIGWDHMNLLGDTLSKIATEKAGIIKYKRPVVISEYQKDIHSIFINKAKFEKSPIYLADEMFKIDAEKCVDNSIVLKLKNNPLNINNITLDLTGTYQKKNIKGVLIIIKILKELGIKINKNAVQQGLSNVIRNTGLKGRWQKLRQKPLIYCDTGHNIDGIKEVLENISKINYNKLHFVLGMVSDKDISPILKLLPPDAYYYFCKANIERGLAADILCNQALEFGLKGKVYKSVKLALKSAIRKAQKDDLIFVGGSNFTVAEVL